MRIDIRLIPSNSYPFAILYFTGSKQTNTYMRNQAIKLNLKLNEYGLFDKDNNPILLKTEEDIFNYLNIEYKHPNQR
jgi:DNA polymerase (family 10)